VSEFFDRLGDELEKVGHRRARRPRFAFAWSRRTFALAAIAALVLISVPAAAVTGVFKPARAPLRPDATQPTQMGSIGPPCVDKRERQLRTTTDAPPVEVTSQLAVLRRPQRPADRLAGAALEGLALLPIDAVNPDAIRLAGTLDGIRIYLVPAANVRYFPPLPDTEGCNRLEQPDIKPIPGVCLVEHHAAATCSDVRAIRRGLTMLTGGGRRHSLTRVAGIAHDGVSAVIWRVHRGKGFLDTRIPVRNNVYAANAPSRAGHGLYVYFETASGLKLVRGPHRFTKRELAQLRRDKALDNAAGPKPTVFPESGTARTIFTVRMHVPPKNKIYVATWTAPAGTTCAQSKANNAGLLPALKGPLAGLIKAYFGPPAADRRWCPGTYDGTIRTQRYRNDVNGPIVGRFSFVVR
jgi:hypothetical protein